MTKIRRITSHTFHQIPHLRDKETMSIAGEEPKKTQDFDSVAQEQDQKTTKS
jgi:hypothetical protein